MKKIFKISFILLIIFSFANHMFQDSVAAQGEGFSQYKPFYEESKNNFLVSIFISPLRPVAGQQIFSIKITDKLTNNPVENLKIDVYATPLFDEKKQFSPALSSSVMPGNYQAILRLEKHGFWVMDFEISGDDLEFTISEQLEVLERNRTLGNSDFSYAFLLIQALFFGGLIYILISARKRRNRINN
ncbi:MAG: hypothetical protein P8K05_02700 [Dehalococcoidia bacterium]|nr:hypothetical protein [Dehalococcoidia bacterium]